MKKTLIIFAAAITVSAMLSGCLQPRNSGTGDSFGTGTSDTSDVISDISDDSKPSLKRSYDENGNIYGGILQMGDAVLDTDKTIEEYLDSLFDCDPSPYIPLRDTAELFPDYKEKYDDVTAFWYEENLKKNVSYLLVFEFRMEEGYVPGMSSDNPSMRVYLGQRTIYEAGEAEYDEEKGTYSISIDLYRTKARKADTESDFGTEPVETLPVETTPADTAAIDTEEAGTDTSHGTPSDDIIYVSELTVGNAVLDPGKTFGEIIDGMFDYDTHPFGFRRSSVELYGFEAFCAADLENGRINETDRPEADGKYVVVVGFVLEDGYALAPGSETDLYTLDIYMDGYMAKLGLDSRIKYDTADVCFIAETGEYVINIILRKD